LALYQVPNLVGDDLVTAERVLVQDRLTIGLIAEQQSGQPAGTIVQTNPEANTAVPSGTTINLVVAE
jgi:beta-lactam-binding protein with PASTA domain